jgi:Protein of unknown function (DUF3105)
VTHRLVALVAALLLVAVACGGGGDGGGGDDGGGDGEATVTGATASPQRLGGDEPLADVQVYSGLSETHVQGPITYRQTPPVGGDHHDAWLTCGAYDEPVPSENAVHSLQHGAVWITHRPSLPAGQQETLRSLVADEPFLVVSPWTDDDLPSPVVLSAWGLQLGVDSATDPAVEAFVGAFAQGPQTREPGATCAGGIGDPVAIAGG